MLSQLNLEQIMASYTTVLANPFFEVTVAMFDEAQTNKKQIIFFKYNIFRFTLKIDVL